MRILNRFWYDVLDRSLDSLAVWGLYAPDFKVWDLTLAGHAAQTNTLQSQIRVVAECEQTLRTARDSRDTTAVTLRDLYVRACDLICGSLPKGSPALDNVRAVRTVRGRSKRAVQDKGDRVAAFWKLINEMRAQESPALPPLLVGPTSVGELESTLGNYALLLTNIANKEAPARQASNRMKATGGTLYQNNTRWYQAWQGQFAKGSMERAALSQIDTGPAQPLPGTGVMLGVEWLPPGAVMLSFGAARATRFTLLHEGPGEAAFTVLADGLTEPGFTHTGAAAGAHRYKVIGRNSAGAGAESSPLQVAVAAVAVA